MSGSRLLRAGVSAVLALAVVVMTQAPAHANAPIDRIEAVYVAALGRGSDQAGHDYWEGVADANGLESMVWSFLHTPEVARTLVDQAYTLILGRDGDPGGLDYFTSKILGGADIDDVERVMLSSQEVFDRASIGVDTNEDFVSYLYHLLLGRTPEPTGLAFWLDGMSSGWSRDYVVGRILGDFENEARQVDRAYTWILDRAPDTDGAYWWRVELSLHSTLNVVARIAGSPEFASHGGPCGHLLHGALTYGLNGDPAPVGDCGTSG